MLRRQTWRILGLGAAAATLGLLLGLRFGGWMQPSSAPSGGAAQLPGAEPGAVAPLPLPGIGEQVVYDINLHDPQRLLTLLRRLDALQGAPAPAGRRPVIAIVLHGPELLHFTRSRYAQNRELVDLAARLDAFGVVEVKACLTRMLALGLRREDLPAFIDFVPYGPDEVRRLEERGYRVM